MADHDTLPPEPHEPMAPLTEERFRKILGEVVGDKLLEIHEDLKRCLTQLEEHNKRLGNHDVQIEELRRDLKALEERVNILELQAAHRRLSP